MQLTRALVVRAILATSVVAGGAGVAAANTPQPVELPTPVLSLSTLTLTNRDSVAVVIAYTMRCSTSGICPTRWRVAAKAGDDSLGHIRTTLRDTLRVAKPICPAVLTARAQVIADNVTATSGIISSKTAAASTPIQCRARTAAEIAWKDSFPDGNRKIVLASNWMYKTSNAAESLYVVQDKAGEIQIPLGYRAGPMCWLIRNRYTGKVIVHMADPEDRCENVRKAFESARDG